MNYLLFGLQNFLHQFELEQLLQHLGHLLTDRQSRLFSRLMPRLSDYSPLGISGLKIGSQQDTLDKIIGLK